MTDKKENKEESDIQENQESVEDQETTEDSAEKDTEKKKVDPVERLRGRKVLEQRAVHVSCRAQSSENCKGNKALMTVDPRNRSYVRYKCEECHGSWTVAKGDSFTF